MNADTFIRFGLWAQMIGGFFMVSSTLARFFLADRVRQLRAIQGLVPKHEHFPFWDITIYILGVFFLTRAFALLYLKHRSP